MVRDILDMTEARVREVLDLAEITVEGIESGSWHNGRGEGYPFLVVRLRSDYDLALAQAVLASHRIEYWTSSYKNSLKVPCLPNPDRFCGRLVQAVGKVIADAQNGHDDVEAWHAPSECHGLVEQRTERELRKVLEAFKVTPAQYGFLVTARTSDKWAYYNGHTSTVMSLRD